jgi:hypothetical protein
VGGNDDVRAWRCGGVEGVGGAEELGVVGGLLGLQVGVVLEESVYLGLEFFESHVLIRQLAGECLEVCAERRV